MKPQLSQDYNVDARYHGGKGSVDNSAGKAFVNRYIQNRREVTRPNMEAERQMEDRFIVRGPGDAGYSFRNGFRASK